MTLDDTRAWRDPVAVYLHSLRRVPGSVEVPLGLAAQLRGRSRHEEALFYLRQVVELAPREPLVHLAMGMNERLLGRLGAARVDLERAIALGSPDLARAHEELGLVLIAQGDLAGAVPELRLSLQAREEPRVLANLGLLLARRGDRERARAALVRSLELDPEQEKAADMRTLIAHLQVP